MKKILFFVLSCAFIINCKAQVIVTSEESSEVIKIVNEYLCPYDISDNKEHVILQAWGEDESYYWSEKTGIISIHGSGFAITDEGVIAGTFTNESEYKVAGLWYPDTQEWEFLGMNPDVPEFSDVIYNNAWTMSNDGKKLGIMQYDAAWNTYSYVWSEEDGYVKISNGPSTVTRPQGMNSDGSIIAGSYVDDMGYKAPCYWLEGELFPISSYLGESWGVSPNGRYVCGNLKNSQGNAFIYDIIEDSLILIKNTISSCPGSMRAMCVTDNGDAFGYISVNNSIDYALRRGFAYVNGETMLFEEYLMINGVEEADSWSTYCVNSVTPDGKTFLGATNMKGQDYTFVVTIADVLCEAPKNLTYSIDDNKHNSIILNWDAPENAVDVTYEIYTAYTEIDPIYQGITETSFTIEDLDAGYYKFLVRANWNGECLSNPSNAVTPIIYPCAQEDMCEITFKMLDGYGDGWNGAYIEVIPDSSDFSYSVGLEKEGLDTVVKNISLCSDKYTFIWHRGEFDEEISFAIIFNEREIYRADTNQIDYMFEVSFLEYEINCNEEPGDNTENISDAEPYSSFNIYPTPVNDKLYIETEVEIKEVAIYTITGVMVGQQTTDNRQQTLSIDVTNLNSGVYFVKIITNDGEVVKRFVKK